MLFIFSFPQRNSSCWFCNLLWYSVTSILKPTAFLTHGCRTENHHSSLADGLNLRCMSLSSHREVPISHFLLLAWAYWEGLWVRIAALPFFCIKSACSVWYISDLNHAAALYGAKWKKSMPCGPDCVLKLKWWEECVTRGLLKMLLLGAFLCWFLKQPLH